MNDEQTREQQLVTAARDGDESAFETLVRLQREKLEKQVANILFPQ